MTLIQKTVRYAPGFAAQHQERDGRAQHRPELVHRPVEAEVAAQIARIVEASAMMASRGAVRTPLPKRSTNRTASTCPQVPGQRQTERLIAEMPYPPPSAPSGGPADR